MKHKRFIITAPVLAVTALAVTSAESSASVPPHDPQPTAVVPHEPGPPNYPTYDPAYAVPTQPSTGSTLASNDDTTTEALQAATSALGGAGIALACTWLYRRRQTHIA
ncbi:hypothetical protein [Kribbella sp. C-35]|uniref:hypothetical protein n=1 Tax=Kribbella sp. C-35 TaxID=2789276 RepID=UPI00397CEFAE